MRFDASQHMRMGQHMRLAPHMIQSMEILQMPLGELEERIEQELESNATLELADDGPSPDGQVLDGSVAGSADASGPSAEDGPLKVDGESAAADFERLDSFEESNPESADNEYSAADARTDYSDRAERTRTSDQGDRDAKTDAMANTAARPESTIEQLQEQWGLVDVDESLRPLGAMIINFIEADGYLRTPLETIADRAPGGPEARPTPAALERALRAVQLMLDPPGIAARDTRECLLLQIDAREDQALAEEAAEWELVRKLVEDHLDDLAQNRLPRVVQKTGATMEQIKKAVERLRTLSLAPGRLLVQTTEPGIVPDAFVEYDADQDRYIAYLNDSRLPNLRINQEYARLAKDRQAPKPTRDFIKTNLANAQFLLDAIEQRRRTLLRVIEVVVGAQREFFDYGPQAVKPLPMTKVAEQLGVHVATVSRAVAEKYLQTPRGIVPLRKFFTGGTVTESGEEVSWDAIKGALSDVIEKEDKKNPLSDDQLVEELKKRGLEIARRTVAKYRGQLGIPTGRLRKVHE